MDSNQSIEQPVGVYALIPYALMPIVVAFVVFGPGLTDLDGLIIRVILGIVWVIGGFSTCFLAARSLVNSVYSQNVQRKASSVLVGYVLVVIYAVLWSFLAQTNEKSITRMVNNNIPVGSSRTQVVTFLKAEGIQYNDEYDNALRARIFNDVFNESGFDVYFSFDKNEKMTNFGVFYWNLEGPVEQSK